MSEQEGFLSRWSRLKRESEHDGWTGRTEATPAEVPETIEEELVDLEALPPIESLGGESDYKPFLARGIPEELQRLALRQAWRSDPKIAGFRGFADYDWDCNAPGYGQLLPTDNIRRLCDAILGKEPEADAQGGQPTPDAPAADTVPVAAPSLPDSEGYAPAEPDRMTVATDTPLPSSPMAILERDAERHELEGAALARPSDRDDELPPPGERSAG